MSRRHFIFRPAVATPGLAFKDMQKAGGTTTFTFTTGPDNPKRYLLAVISWASSNANAFCASATIGGTGFTAIGGSGFGPGSAAARASILARIPFTTGQSAAVVVTMNSLVGSVWCSVWEVNGTPALVSQTFTNNQAQSTSANGGLISAVAGQYSGTYSPSVTPSTLEKTLTDAVSPFFYSSVSDLFPTTGANVTNNWTLPSVVTLVLWSWAFSIT